LPVAFLCESFTIHDKLLQRARAVTGIQERTALLRAGLEAVITRDAGERLADGEEYNPSSPTFPGGVRPDVLADTPVWIADFREALL